MPKGFVLTLDAALATIIVLVSGLAVAVLLLSGEQGSLARLNSYTLGSDFLLALDKSGKLSDYVGKPEGVVNDDLKQQLSVLPQQYCGNVTLNVYKEQSGFVLDKSYGAVSDCAPPRQDFSRVKRIFVNFDKERFGLALIDMWLR